MAENIGKFHRSSALLLTLSSSPGKLPPVLTALTVTNPTIGDMEDNLVIEWRSTWATMWFAASAWT